jgi:aspartyl-tRNA(Asn)/glutamyl-tRNA(Gln) amidotransferase subunit A
MSLFQHAKQYIANYSKYAHLNAFISRVDPSMLSDRPKLPRPQDDESISLSVRDKPIAIKDNICTKELKTTAASGILRDFTSPYDATVVKLLHDAGAVVVGKTNMDEFGMGSHSTQSHAGSVKMQRYEGEEASAGGSSGGSALAVASAQCWAALGTDTGGSVRLPAAYTGVVGFKPSYGLLSRWGVIAYANSLDTVGIFAKNAQIVGDIFDKLNVHDPQDPTSLSPTARSRLASNGEHTGPLRIGIPLDYNISTLHPTVRHTLHPVRLPATQHALSAYYVLAPAEASSNLAKYDGVRFGSRAEGTDGTPESVLFAKTRGLGLGAEVQRRILLGAFSLSAQAIDNYFIQAQKVRRLVQQDFNNVFAKAHPLGRGAQTKTSEQEDGVDVLLCPTAPTLAPSLSDVRNQDPIQAYMNDVFTVPASLAGLPAISVPVHLTDAERATVHGEHDVKESAGIQIIGQYGDDKLVLHAARGLQKACRTVQRDAWPDTTAWGVSSLGKSTVRERQLYKSLALELDITIAEAVPIGEERLRRKKQRVGHLLTKTLGIMHLDEAAKILNIERKDYTARFVNEEDPIAAEKAFFDKLSAWWRRVEAGREQKAGTIPRDDRKIRDLRLAMLEPASGEPKGTKGKWGGKVRFVGVNGERRGDGR